MSSSKILLLHKLNLLFVSCLLNFCFPTPNFEVFYQPALLHQLDFVGGYVVEFRGSLEPQAVAAQEFASAAACLHSSFCSSRDAVSVPLHSQRICCTGGMSGA